ncbi:FdhF/YdeP family oxidoreductase [Leptolyngbya sp. CCNP1308]|uniref:FdhF/YdeP family oxidoreductase n=1 Tax=Leptolyngbya sp. CCNP1308 TaxID=3110255 RepID=UPI002B218634|nr:FdhF/YdeP family oxidoreductase [Leptolyngbya sp. CCNP1308]MEA5450007.1 FdhF/YdeP family oxidoreductase [Leptolyngbya sp. CCNP1308]
MTQLDQTEDQAPLPAASDRDLPHSLPAAEPTADSMPIGGGLPIIQYWAQKTLSPQGPQIWKTLFHKSACLSCAWGTGGQNGGFINELEEPLQRCMKSVQAISSELQPGLSDHFFARHTISELQALTSREADRLGRLSFPVIRRAGSDHYEPIAWDEIYQLTTAGFSLPPERVASYSSGRSSNEAAFLLQLMVRAFGSNNLADCSDLCHAPSTVSLNKVFGTGTSLVSLESLRQADCVVLVGSNAPANHPRLMNELIELRDRGGKVIAINPVKEVGLVKFGSPAHPLRLVQGEDIASLFLQPIPGSDLALFVGIQKVLLERGWVQFDYLKAHTENWQAVIDQVAATDWEAIVATCGLTLTEIMAAAEMIHNSKNVVFAWAMGITHQANSVDNIYSIANTALMTGNVGKPGAGMMPIRGHSNVQGFGSMGVTAHLKASIREALEKLLGKSLQREPGYDARALIEASDRGEVDTLLCLGGNLYAANPDLTQAKRALGNIDTIIYLATKPNQGHFHGLARQNTIIVPVYARFENPHKTTVESGNNFVRLNSPGKTHLKGADLVTEIDFLAELAHRIHGDQPIDWRRLYDTRYVRQLIAQTIPGYEKIGEIDETNAEFTIGGRIFLEPKFPTPSGKAEMQTTPLPDLTLPTLQDFDLSDDQHPALVLALITGRSYGQHNTVVYKEADEYRGMPHRHCILMNPLDAERAGFSQHQRVSVRGDAGQLDNIEIIFGEVRSGAALMFYPEANVLMKARIEKRAGTPAYKRVPVAVFFR